MTAREPIAEWYRRLADQFRQHALRHAGTERAHFAELNARYCESIVRAETGASRRPIQTEMFK